MWLWSAIKQVSQGKSLLRALMNLEIAKYRLAGSILDIGGGDKPSYYHFFKGLTDCQITNIDLYSQGKKAQKIDLEDSLPFANQAYDFILMFNILEHIYNHQNLMSEASRVLKVEGKLIGFVPFLLNYHPDPHDYFRYTQEALAKIFEQAGFKEIDIKSIGAGPLAVNFNNLYWLPNWLRVFLYPFYYLLDKLILKLRPSFIKNFPLGYFFILNK
jgi:SAM-dependent methyltransferase